MIAIVDYGRGNLFGLSHALAHIGMASAITSEPAALDTADLIILPGVGAFGPAKADLDRRGMTPALLAAAKKGVPILGICLGMQLLMDESHEFGRHAGLGLIAGSVRRLPAGAVRIPNVGWRRLYATGNDPVFSEFDGMMGYFNHTFGAEASNAHDVALTISVNGMAIAASVRRKNISGFQFHPEKSGPRGLQLLAHAIRQST